MKKVIILLLFMGNVTVHAADQQMMTIMPSNTEYLWSHLQACRSSSDWFNELSEQRKMDFAKVAVYKALEQWQSKITSKARRF